MVDRELTAELIDVVTKIWNKYQNVDIITKKFGIPKDVIKKYVKFARLPKLLQDNLNTLHKNPKTAMNIALDACDVLDYVPIGPDPTSKLPTCEFPEYISVLDLAKELAKAKSKSRYDYKKLKRAARENPNKSIKEIKIEAKKIRKLPKNRIRAVWAHLRSKKLQARMKPETAKKYKALARKLKQTAKERGGKPKDYLKEFLWMASNKIN